MDARFHRHLGTPEMALVGEHLPSRYLLAILGRHLPGRKWRMLRGLGGPRDLLYRGNGVAPKLSSSVSRRIGVVISIFVQYQI